MIRLALLLLMAVTQSHYRFGINELAESTHGWYANEDANPAQGQIALDTTFLLRFCLQCDATAQSNVDAEFQYRLNGGTWTNISTTSTVVRAVSTTVFTNGANTTKRLSGTGTFETSSAGCTTDGISGGTAFDIVASGNGETECAMQIRSADVAHGDVIEFRLTRDGGVLLNTYAVTPSYTVSKPTNQTLTAGTPVVTLTAPSASLILGPATLAAGTPTVTLSAPAADLVQGGGPQTLVAGTPVVTVTAPSAAVVPGPVALAAGPGTVALSAPAATAVPGPVACPAGPAVLTFSAPSASILAEGGSITLPAGTPAVVFSAPAVSVLAACALPVGTPVVALSAPSAAVLPGPVVCPAGPAVVQFDAPSAVLIGSGGGPPPWRSMSGLSGLSGGGHLEAE